MSIFEEQVTSKVKAMKIKESFDIGEMYKYVFD